MSLKTGCFYALVAVTLAGFPGALILPHIFPHAETQVMQAFANFTVTYILPAAFVVGWIKGYRARRAL